MMWRPRQTHLRWSGIGYVYLIRLQQGAAISTARLVRLE